MSIFTILLYKIYTEQFETMILNIKNAYNRKEIDNFF